MKLLEDDNGIPLDKLDYLDKRIDRIPYYHTQSSSPEFPYYQHLLVERNDDAKEIRKVNSISEIYPFFFEIMDEFCKKNDIKYKSIIRACLNNTYHIPGYEYQDPHLDAKCPHLIFMMYLNDATGDTFIFEDEWNPEDDIDIYYCKKGGGFNSVSIGAGYRSTVFDKQELTIKHRITPKRGKIAVFDGKHFHAIGPTGPGEIRSICIMNLSI